MGKAGQDPRPEVKGAAAGEAAGGKAGGKPGGKAGGSTSPAGEAGGKTGGQQAAGEKAIISGLADVKEKKPTPPKQGIPGLALIDFPAQTEAGETKPKTTKKKGRKQSPKDKAAEEVKPAVTGLLGAVFTAGGTKNPIWQVTDQEIEMIADPASKILARLELSQGASEYADYIALLIALAAVCGPRIAITAQARKEAAKIAGNADRTPAVSGGQDSAGGSTSLRAGGNVKAILPGLAS